MGTPTDNRAQHNGVTYDAITAEHLLGISSSQLNTLVRKGVLLPCTAPAPGAKKHFRRFTADAIESARGKMAEVLQPQRPKGDTPDSDVLERIDTRLATIEDTVMKLLKAMS